MAVSITYIFTVGVITVAIFIPHSQTQLSEDEVPDELKYVLHSGLEEWEPPKELSQKLPYYLSGFDSENRPIWIVEFGKWDLRSLLEKGEKWEKLVDKYVDKWLWRLYISSFYKATEETPVKEGVLIIDFEGLTHRQFSSPAALAFFLNKMRTVVFALPFAHDVFVLNANFVAKHALEMLRPIIGKDFHRVEIYGTNPNSYKHILLKRLPKDQLPEWYGGDKNFKPVEIYG